MCATTAKKKKKSKKNGIDWGRMMLIVLLFVAAFTSYKVFGPNTSIHTPSEYLYIKTGASFTDVKNTLRYNGLISDIYSFDMLARIISYPSGIHPGKYTITSAMSNFAILKMLHSGRQTPVRLVINKLRTKQEIIHLIASNLEADSSELYSLFTRSSYLSPFQLDTNTVVCGFIPDTYEFFWNTSADKACRKIFKNYQHFWTTERKKAAQARGLSPIQAIIIASIVEEETNKNDEKTLVASVYINRFNNHIKLQADPTVRFAIGDFSIRRINTDHLVFPSPYNTYLYEGLPPGPICTPSVSSINAVLAAPDNKYLYFCAREDFSGYHRFATTYVEHLKNAHLYQHALNQKGIH